MKIKTTLRLRSVSVALMLTAYCLLPTHSFAQVANGTGAGNCLNFNGSSDYVEIANEANFDALFDGAHPFTLSWWQYSYAYVGGNGFLPMIMKREVGIQVLAPAYWLYTGNLGFSLNSADGGGAPPQLSGYWRENNVILNQWVYYTITYDGSFTCVGVNGYRNGISLGVFPCDKQTLSSPLTNNGNVHLVSSIWGGNALNAQIDEVRIYNRALGQDEIRATMCQKLKGTENGLVGYWRFDEGSGGTARDSQTNVAANDGTLH